MEKAKRPNIQDLRTMHQLMNRKSLINAVKRLLEWVDVLEKEIEGLKGGIHRSR